MPGRLQLLRRLFCGRNDVYAMRGAEGYVPRRRRLTRQALKRHIRGESMLGSYPHLPGDHCPWIAADFDGKGHRDTTPERLEAGEAIAHDQAADLCRVLAEKKVPHLVNTSRSAKGFHVRIFFRAPVPCYVARALMQSCLEAANVHPSSDGVGFDRMFPTSDIIDYGRGESIGNQIAMPLNGEALDHGGTAVLDEEWNPIRLGPALWDRLESQKRLSQWRAAMTTMEVGGRRMLVAPAYRAEYYKSVDEEKRLSWGLGRVVRACRFFTGLACKEPLSYSQWVFLASQLSAFEGGRAAFHYFSSLDERRYVWGSAEKTFNYIADHYKPFTCAWLAKNGWTCPQLGENDRCKASRLRSGLGAKAPASVVYCH